jgi:hypothetical protein
MIAVLHSSHPMLVYFVINERPTDYTATGKILTSATTRDVIELRKGMDSLASGTLRIT